MVQYFPVITGSLTVNGDIIVSGTSSMSASNSVSSSYAYTASSAISSSYAYSASSAVNSFSASKAVSSSYADTASFANNFTVIGNLTVFGTQSVQYITSSQLNVSDNVITVNVASPGVRFGGLSVFDSGSLSSEATASLFWDSQNNHWIYQRESGSSYTGGMLISGPRNAAGLGNELGTTACMLLVGQGGDHLTSSMIYHDSTRTCIPNILNIGGALSASSATFTSDAQLNGGTGTRTLTVQSNTSGDAVLQLLAAGSNGGNIVYKRSTSEIVFNNNSIDAFKISGTGAATFSNSFTTSDTPVLFLSPNLGTNQSLFLQLGKNISSTYNSGEVSFKYVGDGSTSNMVSLGFYGSGQKLNVLGNGNVGIGTTPSYKLDINNGASGVVLNLEGTNAYNAETGILMSAGRAKISGFLNGTGGTPGTSLRFYTMPDEGSVTERIRITSAGNVGIGACNPNTIFQVISSTNNNTTSVEGQTRLFNTFDGGVATIGFSSNSGGAQDGRAGIAAGKDPISGITGFLAFSVRKDAGSFVEAMRITSAGKVGVGIATPETLFDVADSSSNTLVAVRNTSTANTTGKNAMYGFIGTDTVGTPKSVGGMQAVPNDVNWVNGLLYWYVRAGDGQALRMSLSSGGALVISGALTQNGSPSDINLKENLVKISSPLEKISQINGYTFDWKEGSPARGCISNIVQDAGIVAQEIETILPEIVRTSDDNKVVNYNGLVALLIEGMKEQQCTINTLKTCIGIA